MSIKSCLFDAFGTLVVPRTPVHIQYAEIARSYGIVLSNDDDLKQAFFQAFKELAARYPFYGHASDPPLGPEAWWEFVIERAFGLAGVCRTDLQAKLPTLTPVLLKHFSSKAAYQAPPDVLEGLSQLKQEHPDLELGVITNSDPRIVDVLKGLDIVPRFIPLEHVTTSWGLKVPKPDKQIFQHAASKFKCNVSLKDCLHVGDEIDEDFYGAYDAGLQSVLLARRPEILPHALKGKESDTREPIITSANTITSIADLSSWIREHRYIR